MPFPDKNVSVIADKLFQHYLITGTNSIHAQLAQKNRMQAFGNKLLTTNLQSLFNFPKTRGKKEIKFLIQVTKDILLQLLQQSTTYCFFRYVS